MPGKETVSVQPPSPHAASYRADIDGLRAIAVLSVVFYHAGFPGFTGGFVGVDVFFVISGFLITGIVWKDLQHGRFSLLDFYMRRTRRIMPALFFTLGLSAVAAYFLLIPVDLIAFGRSLNATVLFYSNFFFVKEVGYFGGPAIDKPLLHTWSLSVEEQFYAVWPLVFAAASRYLPPKRLLAAVLVLTLISLAMAQSRLDSHPKDSFYLPYYRIWELMAGAALALAPAFVLSRRLSALSAFLGLAAIFGAVCFFDIETPFPGLTALAPCLGAVLLIAGGRTANPVSRLLGRQPFRFIGLISYSLYLVHWPILSFTHLYLNDVLTLPQRIVVVTASFVLAVLSWRYVETPFRRPATGPKRVYWGAAAASAGALCLAGAFFIQTGGFPHRADAEILASENFGAQTISRRTKFCSPLRIEGLDGGVVCSLGRPKPGGFEFVLWGDSHAAHYLPAVATLAESNGVFGALLSFPNCPPLLGEKTSNLCEARNERVIHWIADNKSIRTVLLGARWTGRFRAMKTILRKPDADFSSGPLSGTLRALQSLSVETVILGQVPLFKQNVSTCLARALFFLRPPKLCGQEAAKSAYDYHKPMNEYFVKLRSKFVFTLFDPAEAFCTVDLCRSWVDGKFLMLDESHMSEEGALRVAPFMNIPGLNRPSLNSQASGRASLSEVR